MKGLFSLAIVVALLAARPLLAETVTVQPGQNLQEAADKLQPGDTLLLAEGTYCQNLKLKKSGTAGSPITIKAKTPGKVVITGAMETAPAFEKVEDAVYKTKWAVPKDWKQGGTGKAWVVADDRNLFNYTSLEEMKALRKPGGKPTEGSPHEGFFCQGEEMYVRLLGGADPNKANMAVSRPDAGVLVEVQGQQHIVLEGLRFHVAPAAGIRIGTSRTSEVCRHIAIRDCHFFGCHEGIRGQGSQKDGPTDITIEYCQFSNYPVYQWVRYGQLQQVDTWKAIYDSTLGGGRIEPGRSARAWKIKHCYLHESFDGIGVATSGDKDPAALNEYTGNLLQNCADDAIEFDAIDYAGVRAHRNVLLDGFTNFGCSPVQSGGVTIENNLLYVSPEYGLPWGVMFKFSTPSANAFHVGGFHPLSGMIIRNNSLVHTTCLFQWGASSKPKPSYFKDDNIVANNLLYARDWVSMHGFPWKLGLSIEKNNLCCGPTIVAGKDLPEGILCTRNTEPFIKRDTYRWDVLPPLLPELAAEGDLGEEREIERVNFTVGEDYVRAAAKECGFAEAEYKDVHKNLGAIPPGTKWEFTRPGPRWAVGELALFHPPFPPSLDPWWVGFADKPSDAKTVKIRPWRGKLYREIGSIAFGAKVAASGYLTGKAAEGRLKWLPQTDCGPGNAVDGDLKTGWLWDSRESKEPAWLEIDLGAVKAFNFVEVANVTKCVGVEIAVKRGEKWETIHTLAIDPEKKPPTYSARVPSTEARYVRLVVKTVPNAQDACVSEVRLLQLP